VRLLVATKNPGKAREFADMLGDRADVSYLTDFPQSVEVAETGLTFRANACLKASGYAQQTGLWTIADDSGLEVPALGGAPGVYSARYAEREGAGEGDAANNALLLANMKDLAEVDRDARFVCVLALADPQGRILLTTRATMDGRIGFAPRGAGGFGYDPLFEIVATGRTTAELSPAEKHAMSHRGKALAALKTLMDGRWPPTGQSV
jgi:XTP/dITP diphosphohydrolase